MRVHDLLLLLLPLLLHALVHAQPPPTFAALFEDPALGLHVVVSPADARGSGCVLIDKNIHAPLDSAALVDSQVDPRTNVSRAIVRLPALRDTRAWSVVGCNQSNFFPWIPAARLLPAAALDLAHYSLALSWARPAADLAAGHVCSGSGVVPSAFTLEHGASNFSYPLSAATPVAWASPTRLKLSLAPVDQAGLQPALWATGAVGWTVTVSPAVLMAGTSDCIFLPPPTDLTLALEPLAIVGARSACECGARPTDDALGDQVLRWGRCLRECTAPCVEEGSCEQPAGYAWFSPVCACVPAEWLVVLSDPLHFGAIAPGLRVAPVAPEPSVQDLSSAWNVSWFAWVASTSTTSTTSSTAHTYFQLEWQPTEGVGAWQPVRSAPSAGLVDGGGPRLWQLFDTQWVGRADTGCLLRVVLQTAFGAVLRTSEPVQVPATTPALHNISVQLDSINGTDVAVISWTPASTRALAADLSWHAMDEFGNELANGTFAVEPGPDLLMTPWAEVSYVLLQPRPAAALVSVTSIPVMTVYLVAPCANYLRCGAVEASVVRRVGDDTLVLSLDTRAVPPSVVAADLSVSLTAVCGAVGPEVDVFSPVWVVQADSTMLVTFTVDATPKARCTPSAWTAQVVLASTSQRAVWFTSHLWLSLTANARLLGSGTANLMNLPRPSAVLLPPSFRSATVYFVAWPPLPSALSYELRLLSASSSDTQESVYVGSAAVARVSLPSPATPATKILYRVVLPNGAAWDSPSVFLLGEPQSNSTTACHDSAKALATEIVLGGIGLVLFGGFFVLAILVVRSRRAQRKNFEGGSQNFQAPDMRRFAPQLTIPRVYNGEGPREIDISCFTILAPLGEGKFGLVRKALMHENIPGMFEYLVAMKSLHPTATADERRDFFSEAKIMQYLDHPHVLPVLGQVTKHFNGEHYIVLPYCENGNLLEYLILHAPAIDENQQITWAAQTADALTYLAEQRIVHRDVAARNILLNSSLVCKLSDFGLARRILDAVDDHVDAGITAVPVRWCAPEVLKDRLYTLASDVYSYGVVLYEIFSFGEKPFKRLSNYRVWAAVLEGTAVLECPVTCPSGVYAVMKECWQQDHRQRPAIANVARDLRSHNRSALSRMLGDLVGVATGSFKKRRSARRLQAGAGGPGGGPGGPGGRSLPTGKLSSSLLYVPKPDPALALLDVHGGVPAHRSLPSALAFLDLAVVPSGTASNEGSPGDTSTARRKPRLSCADSEVSSVADFVPWHPPVAPRSSHKPVPAAFHRQQVSHMSVEIDLDATDVLPRRYWENATHGSYVDLTSRSARGSPSLQPRHFGTPGSGELSLQPSPRLARASYVDLFGLTGAPLKAYDNSVQPSVNVQSDGNARPWIWGQARASPNLEAGAHVEQPQPVWSTAINAFRALTSSISAQSSPALARAHPPAEANVSPNTRADHSPPTPHSGNSPRAVPHRSPHSPPPAIHVTDSEAQVAAPPTANAARPAPFPFTAAAILPGHGVRGRPSPHVIIGSPDRSAAASPQPSMAAIPELQEVAVRNSNDSGISDEKHANTLRRQFVPWTAFDAGSAASLVGSKEQEELLLAARNRSVIINGRAVTMTQGSAAPTSLISRRVSKINMLHPAGSETAL